MVLLLLLIICAAIVFVGYLGVAAWAGAPFIPTAGKTARHMVALANVQPGETFVDLGAGDGRLLIAAAKRGARAIGYEINPFLVAFARLRILLSGTRGLAHMHCQSLWDADLRTADVVGVFGIPSMMPRLQKKLSAELPVDARVVSNIFSFPEWEPMLHERYVRVYQKPFDRAREK